ncbi:hypothetical protein ACJJIU_18240 [Microbulbifer sp. CnH-101-E]|uniref:hypothetical protein n=1 Tax=unclassified Microbulbifer TaxID=2619833 RepID=UPI00403A4E41
MSTENLDPERNNQARDKKEDWNLVKATRNFFAFIVCSTTAIIGILTVYDRFVVDKIRTENNRLKTKIETIEKDIKLSDTYMNLKGELAISNGKVEIFGGQLNICLTEKRKMDGISYKIKSIENELESCKTSKRATILNKDKTIDRLSKDADLLAEISALQKKQEEAEIELRDLVKSSYRDKELSIRGKREEAGLKSRIHMMQEQITALYEILKSRG